MAYVVYFSKSSKGDLKKIKHSQLKDKFDQIIKKLSDNPYDPSDSFEKLMPPENEFYSRRLNIQYRIVYSVNDDLKTVHIYSAWNHY